MKVSGSSAGYRPARTGLEARIGQLAGDECLNGAAGLFPAGAGLRHPGIDAIIRGREATAGIGCQPEGAGAAQGG